MLKKKITICTLLICFSFIFVGCGKEDSFKENEMIKENEIPVSIDEETKACDDDACTGDTSNSSDGFWDDIKVDGKGEKPIIYLYPEKEMEVTVKLGNPEKLTCTYPKYDEDGWTVIAKPDGKLIDTETGRNLYALYWEGKGTPNYTLDKGFVVKGEDSISFLEEKLKILGLNEYETEEFIVYWLPQLEANEYNFIRFATKEEIDNYMPLKVSGDPDSIVRVFMQFKGLNEPIKIKEQKLTTPERTGFTVVEWGGTELK